MNDLVRFVPRISPEVGNNQELSVRRQKLLLKADSTDDASAQVGVNRLYVEFVASKKNGASKDVAFDCSGKILGTALLRLP